MGVADHGGAAVRKWVLGLAGATFLAGTTWALRVVSGGAAPGVTAVGGVAPGTVDPDGTAPGGSGQLDQEPSDAELQRFYLEHPRLFSTGVRYAVDAQWYPAGQTGPAEPVMRLPTGPAPRSTLIAYYGPSVMSFLEAAEPGETSGPIGVPGGAWVVHLRDVTVAARPAFEEVAPAVRAVYYGRQPRQRRGTPSQP